VLNGQGNNLVHTRFVEHYGIQPAKSQAMLSFQAHSSAFHILKNSAATPDIIRAERAGSCTDSVATVLRPLLEDFEHYRVAPFTVEWIRRVPHLLNGDAGVNIDVLMRKQAPKPDLICLTKADRFPDSITLELDYDRCARAVDAGRRYDHG
jgi:hypothetical protein